MQRLAVQMGGQTHCQGSQAVRVGFEKPEVGETALHTILRQGTGQPF